MKGYLLLPYRGRTAGSASPGSTDPDMAKKIDMSPIPEEKTFNKVQKALESFGDRQYIENEIVSILHELELLRIRTEFYERLKTTSSRNKNQLLRSLAEKYHSNPAAIEKIVH